MRYEGEHEQFLNEVDEVTYYAHRQVMHAGN